MDICKEVKSRKITVSTGTLAALESEVDQGIQNANFTQPMTHSNDILVDLVNLEASDLI